jgi:uncharacterized protein with PIN domain
MMVGRVVFRFFGELNDFLSRGKRGTLIRYAYSVSPSVKHAIESLGVPHTEVDLIRANGQSVDFSYRLADGDEILVFPPSIDGAKEDDIHLSPPGGGEGKFVLDVHLGRLVRLIRLLGFDSLYRNDFSDAEIVRISLEEERVILTRDIGILKLGDVKRGYWIRSQEPKSQLFEVMKHFHLRDSVKPFSRCLLCNGRIAPVDRESVIPLLDRQTVDYFREFHCCPSCVKIYWKGTHFESMQEIVKSLLDNHIPPGQE